MEFLYIENVVPIRFHSYSSSTWDRILTIDNRDMDFDIESFHRSLDRRFNDFGIECSIDNKTVYECEVHGHRLYFGFYDGVFSVGFSVRKYRY